MKSIQNAFILIVYCASFNRDKIFISFSRFRGVNTQNEQEKARKQKSSEKVMIKKPSQGNIVTSLSRYKLFHKSAPTFISGENRRRIVGDFFSFSDGFDSKS